jgi:hypothetical protein
VGVTGSNNVNIQRPAWITRFVLGMDGGASLLPLNVANDNNRNAGCSPGFQLRMGKCRGEKFYLCPFPGKRCYRMAHNYHKEHL